jgi:hypothetical protein
METRINLRELINKLEELSENGVNDNLPVIVNSDFDDYLYDILKIRFDSLYDRSGKEKRYVSIDLYDNVTPICVEDLETRKVY